MKHGIGFAFVVLSLFACAAGVSAGDGHQDQNQNNHGSRSNKSFNRGNAIHHYEKFSQAITSWKKKKHSNKPTEEPPKSPVTPFPPVAPVTPTPPVTPLPPIITDPIPLEPIVRDHRDPRRPSWGGTIDTSGASGGTVVTTTPRNPKGPIWGAGQSGPVVRDHRKTKQGGVTINDILGGNKDKGPIVRDHRDGTGPIIRDHRK